MPPAPVPNTNAPPPVTARLEIGLSAVVGAVKPPTSTLPVTVSVLPAPIVMVLVLGELLLAVRLLTVTLLLERSSPPVPAVPLPKNRSLVPLSNVPPAPTASVPPVMMVMPL